MANRGGFSNKLGFILAAAGSAVGLGNIWKFPFEVGNGGGAAFVFMYLGFCFLLCFPVMVTEIAIGRKTQLNPVGAFKALGYNNWKFIGLLGIASGVIILSFYNVIAGWAFGYFFEMATGNFEIGKNFGPFVANVTKVGLYAILFMVLTAFIVSRGVSGGIEKAARLLMPALIIMILCLVGYSLTLPNAMTGLKFYLFPNFSAINGATLGGALRQAFFSLSLGMGALITYGSYVSKKDNIVSSAAFITLTDVGIAFIAGLMMFPLVSYSTQGNMSDMEGGAGLIFATLPGVFETLGPLLGIIVGAFFFLLLSFAALTSTVSLLEVPVAYVVDEFKIRRSNAVILVAIVVFLFGLPSLLGNGAVDFFTNNFALPFGSDSSATGYSSDFLSFVAKIADTLLLFGGLAISIFAGHVWKKHNLDEEISFGFENYKTSLVRKLINLGVTIICPLVLFLLLVVVLLSNFAGIDVFTMF